DDLDGVLVGANGAIRAKAIEDGAHGLRIFGGERFVPFESAGGVAMHAHGKMIARCWLGEFRKYGCDHGRREFLTGETVAAAYDARLKFERADFAEGGDHILVKRFAGAARFARAV